MFDEIQVCGFKTTDLTQVRIQRDISEIARPLNSTECRYTPASRLCC